MNMRSISDQVAEMVRVWATEGFYPTDVQERMHTDIVELITRVIVTLSLDREVPASRRSDA
jgi:hypothetical protein